ncbi:LLM class flavin-dependent oxidoreductase [Agromyces sp. CFH 90414]|uniref:LLM class flavin-dependent oxidoreductase n=1 Tax=Agromyces agglutinans TaxID=2662258 RepID=A0A6I2F9C3_9MICO|nr:LLM class flavin-dependent oxidoreductase [Agromyces agglutinans]MRG59310.1 LLM class flavin-dependent oxidoreductase [Agromyces agglutinans]
MRAAVSIGITGRVPEADVRALAPRVEALGFDALWVNDVPHGDSLAALRAAASVTSSLRLATGVVPLDRRPVASLEFAGLPADRLTLGIGSGGAERPLALVREGLDELRTRTDAAIVVGALGPRMRRLAAERADGLLLNWLTPAAATEAMADLRRDAGTVRSGARRPRGILYVRTIADQAARPALEEEAARYAAVPAYAANFERQGVAAIDATLATADGLAAYDVVDELVLRAITPTGSLAELQRFVETVAEWIGPERDESTG